MSRCEAILEKLGKQLPHVPKPVAVYIPAIATGDLVFTSGQLPLKQGKLSHEGIVGRDLTKEQAKEAAEVATLNALAAVKSLILDLDQVRQIVKVNVFVASAPDFTAQPFVANGASELLEKLFGERGRHARAAIGAASLPLNAPVEVELVVNFSPKAPQYFGS